jgi:hypothetical protein
VSALERYLPLAQLGAFIVGWCAAMLTGVLVAKAR